MSSSPSFLHTAFEIFFTFIPNLFFVQSLDLLAAGINGFFGLFGIDSNVVGF